MAQDRPRVTLQMSELLAGLVQLTLEHLDVDVQRAGPGADGGTSDALLVDLDAAAAARGRARSVVGLTRKWEPTARLAAFTDGIDDLVQVPFAPDEIVVRTIGALRRATGRAVSLRPRVTVGRVEVDLLEGGVRLNGQLIRLTVLEQTLLYMLMAAPEKILEREEILSTIWGESSAVTSNVIDRHIRDLRVKLQESWKSPRYIETIPGRGYRFIGGGDGASKQN